MKKVIFVALGVMALVAMVIGVTVINKSRGPRGGAAQLDHLSQSTSSAQTAGQQLADGSCSALGPGQLTHSALDADSFSHIIPYGLMVGGHVTPIDHQYYAVSRTSPRDAYPVYAMGDATLVDIEHRTNSPGDNDFVATHKIDEYRLVFSQTCTFLYYYDLLTSLTPEIEAEFKAKEQNGGFSARVTIPIKAGQIVGRIGGQTLDFAVWDTQKPLTGFAVSDHYQSEPWKRYVADPLDYESPELKQFMLGRYVREAEPKSGKIDYDVDGKLIGTWFEKGTDLSGDKNNRQTPWSTHLSFAPDLYDPSRFIISIGNYGLVRRGDGQRSTVTAHQFYALGNAPDPIAIGPETGTVKYQLVTGEYIRFDGQRWDSGSLTRGLSVRVHQEVQGTVLVKMTGPREITFESFIGQSGDQVNNFDANAKLYTR